MSLRALLLSALVVLAGCSSGGPAWSEAFRDVVEENNEHVTAAEVADQCTAIEPLTDDELRDFLDDPDRQALGLGRSIGFGFDQFMREQDLEPSDADYDAALDIIVSTLRSKCA